MSLRVRIILVYVLLMAASFSCVIWMILKDVRPRYLEAVEESTVDIAELLAASLTQHISGNELRLDSVDAMMAALSERSFSARIYSLTKREVSLRVYITDDKGMLLYDSSGKDRPGADYSQWRDVYLTLRGGYGARSTKTSPDDQASRVIYVAAPIMKDGRLFGVVSVGKPTNSVSFLIGIARQRFLFSLGLVGLTAVALSVILSVWITRPVRRLTDYAHAIRQGGTERPPALGSSEIGVLGAALDEMRTKLEGKAYIEDYVRALTHEMKSPLTGIKGAGEILRDHVSGPLAAKFLDNIDSEVQRLQSLVERMLQLSRLENVRAVSKTRIPAKPFFHALGETFQSQLAAKNLTLRLDIPDALIFEGDELLLRQAVANLIANAIDFAPQGSAIAVSASASGHAQTISVRDQGTGIPDFAIPKVFDKFFSLGRPGSGKKSTGLGLPFVREVVSLHEGEIRLENTHPGLEARIILPI